MSVKLSRKLVATIVGSVIGAGVFWSEMPGVLDMIYQRFAVLPKAQKLPDATNEDDPSADPNSPDRNPPKKAPLKVIPKPAPTIDIGPIRYEDGRKPINRLILTLFGLFIGGAIGSYAGRMFESGLRKWENMAKGDKVTVFVGSMVGIIVSFSLVSVLQSLVGAYLPLVILPMVVMLSGTAIYMMQTMEEALPWYSHAGNRRKSGIKLLDTNVLIDGRVYDIVRCGFLEGQLYVPQFVINELQHIADSSDSQRRQRGRRGLDVLKRIQAEWHVEVGTQDRFAPDAKEEVDSRLVRLAKALGADLVSNDFNLNKVATIQSVTVLNINDLVSSLRPTVLPGEKLSLPVTREGSQPGQGVGYLDDGTMVVIEHAAGLVGQQILCEVSQVIQTERGKMIFADAGGGDVVDQDDRKPQRTRLQ